MLFYNIVGKKRREAERRREEGEGGEEDCQKRYTISKRAGARAHRALIADGEKGCGSGEGEEKGVGGVAR